MRELSDVDILKMRRAGTLKRCLPQLRLIDLFAGAGGMTLGFTPAFGHHFRSVWANDFNADAVSTYNENFGPHCINADILEVLEDPSIVIPEADVVVGGPPCQGFSLLNKNRKADPRKQLWRPFMQVVQRSGASIFVMENVPQLLSSTEYEDMKRFAETMGFHVVGEKLIAADYGVPQTRTRAFVIGCKYANPSRVFPPQKTHSKPAKSDKKSQSELPTSAWITVREAIGDLPPPVGTQIRDGDDETLRLHFGRNPTELSKERYRSIPEEGMNRFDLQRLRPDLTPQCWIRKQSGGTDLFGRLWWERPAFTMRTEFFKPEKGRYLHPEQHRPITHREAARFQSFPDSFRFLGSKIEIARQIGNAVPPKLAARLGDTVVALLSEYCAYIRPSHSLSI